MSQLGKDFRVGYWPSQGMPADDGVNQVSPSLQAVSLQTQTCPWAVLFLENTWIQLLWKATAVSLNTPEFIISLDMPRGWWSRKGERWVSPVSVLAGLGSHWPARDLLPLLMLKNEGYLNASPYIVFHQEKRLTLAEVCLAYSRACFWWADGCQCVRQLCEASSPGTIPQFSSSTQIQKDKGKLHGGKKASGITGIY